MKIKNLTSGTVYCGYDTPSFSLTAGQESGVLPDDYACSPSPRVVNIASTYTTAGMNKGNVITEIKCGALNPAFVADVIARRIEITEGRKFIKITNDTGSTAFFGYVEPGFSLAHHATTSFDVPGTFASIPAAAADIAAGTTDVAASANTDIVPVDLAKVQQINVVAETLVVTDGVTAAQLKANVLAADGTTQTYAVTTSGGGSVPDGNPVLNGYKLVVTAADATTHIHYTVVSGTSSSLSVTSTNAAVVTSVTNTAPLAFSVAFGTDVTAALAALRSTDYSTQVRVITNLAGVTQAGGHVIVAGDKLKVTAEDATTIGNFTASVDANPDIAKVVADMASVTDATIKGGNADLAHVIVALAALPAAGTNLSTITWASSVPGTISNDGQTVNRPLFSLGNATVVMTATFVLNLVTMTKTFTCTVTKAAASSVATVTSGAYTVSAGAGVNQTITNIPVGTARAVFEAALTKGNAYQTWNENAVADPVVSTNTLVVTAEDGVTVKTYTVTVNP